MRDVGANDNDDEGFDLDINTGGDVDVDLLNVTSTESGIDGFGLDISEGGDVNVDLQDVVASNSGDDGINMKATSSSRGGGTGCTMTPRMGSSSTPPQAERSTSISETQTSD